MNPRRRRQNRHGFTLLEMAISAGLGTVLIAGLISASFAIQQSIKGTDHYITSTNDGNRLLDHVAQDLRKAVRVGIISSGTYTPVRNAASLAVSETLTLAINIPDIYASNTPSEETMTNYRVSRYNRAALNTQSAFNGNATGSILNGCVPFAEAITTSGSKQVLRYAPSSAGTGEIQVRYTRQRRSDVPTPRYCISGLSTHGIRVIRASTRDRQSTSWRRYAAQPRRHGARFSGYRHSLRESVRLA